VLRLEIYLVLLILLFSLSVSLLVLVVGKLLRKKFKVDREFQSPFECGFSTFKDHRLKFRLHFFLIALVFVIFDVELIILFPFFREYSLHKRVSSVILFIRFLAALTGGLLNEWNQLILEWSK
jgi:NADH:ubiquinone oxidoreductase subunit 3 (subunit A)